MLFVQNLATGPDSQDLKMNEDSSLSESDMEDELSYHTLTDEHEDDDEDEETAGSDEEDLTIDYSIRNLMMFRNPIGLPNLPNLPNLPASLHSLGFNNYWNNFNLLSLNLHALLNSNLNLNSINLPNLRNTEIWRMYEHCLDSLENFSRSTRLRIGRGNTENLDLIEEFPGTFDDIFVSSKKGIKDPEEKFYNLLKTKDTFDQKRNPRTPENQVETKKDEFLDSDEETEDERVLLSEEYWASLKSTTSDGSEDGHILQGSGGQCITKAPICPFFHRIRYNVYDIIKIIIGTLILAPIRFVFMFVSLVLAWCLAFVATQGTTFEEMQSSSLSNWRRGIRWFVANIIMRIFFFFYGFHWIVKKGKQASSAEAPILVAAPHSSYTDALPLILMGAPSVVAKADTRNVPFFGKLVDLVQAVYVSRDNQHSRHSTVKTIADRVEKIRKDPNWPQIYIYPEGTCSNRSCLVSFKYGAFLPGAPVQPVLIKYPNRLDNITWTFDGPSAFKTLWLTLSQFTNYCELEFLPVYIPSEEEKKDASLFAANVRQVMAEALNVPMVDYSFEDGLAMSKLNVEKIVPRLKGISASRKALDLPAMTEISIMRAISSNEIKDCHVSKSRFAEDFKLNDPDFAHLGKLFSNLEEDPAAVNIDMREYLVYACLINPHIRVDQIVPPFFLMYTEGRKRMSLDGFCQFMSSVFLLSNEEATKIFNTGIAEGQETIDLENFTKKTKKRLEYIKLLALEVTNLLHVYPPRDREINSCKHSSSLKTKCE